MVESPNPERSSHEKNSHFYDKNCSCIFLTMQYFLILKVIMQGKLFQRCTHLLYCSVLSLGGNVNTRRMSQPDMGSIFHIKNQ